MKVNLSFRPNNSFRNVLSESNKFLPLSDNSLQGIRMHATVPGYNIIVSNNSYCNAAEPSFLCEIVLRERSSIYLEAFYLLAFEVCILILPKSFEESFNN